ncbi:MAG: site-specific integrase [Prevotella sp.]|nr:site-specific integrase [Prevotella sp.]
MATITIEIGKKGKKKERAICFLVCHGKTKKRIPTEIFVTDSELTSNGKKVKEPTKAQLIEQMRRKLQDKLFALSLDLAGQDVDAAYIAERLTVHHGGIDFFKFTEEWLKHSSIKSKKNYYCMLNVLEVHLKKRALPFTSINFSMLKGFEEYLNDRPRAKSMYLGLMRHLYREAMRQYNTDHEQVISNDPFMRYKVPRQQLKKGVRALSLDDLLKIYRFEGKPNSRPQLARDTFILSFCLMGMNSVDMYECTDCKDGIIRYNRAKTKDRRSDGAYIEVHVHPFIKELMRKYQGKGHVFNFSARYSDSVTFNANLNKGLKKVGEAVGIDDLEFYQARHTFATLSRNLMKFSKSDVDEALNHVGTMDIADVYITKDFSIINENNFKLIERVFADFLT